MRTLFVVATCLLLSSLAIGQTKFASKYHCGASTSQKSFDVGDVDGHSYGVAQGACEATAAGNGEKSGVYTEFQEMWTTSFKTRGNFVVSMSNGDKLYHTYEAVGDPAKKTSLEHWKVTGGTGKYKGAQGAGTCMGKFNDDGSSDWECTGTSSVK